MVLFSQKRGQQLLFQSCRHATTLFGTEGVLAKNHVGGTSLKPKQR
jgi:hypothetical protein